MTQNKLQKLELTWIGKDDEREAIEPRILIEDPKYSYGDTESGNMLIHGDNLLALKALEQTFSNSVKCVYIDPPFNTGARIDADGKEIGYDDGVEHSIWLGMMYERFEIIYRLLKDDGALFVHLDDNEADYCKIILDEIFGRDNFMNRITIDARSPSAFSTVNPGMFVASEYVLYYAKKRKLLNEKQLRAKRNPDYAYNKYIVNFEKPYTEWRFLPVAQAFNERVVLRSYSPETVIKNYNEFIIENAERICRYTAISDTGAGAKILELKNMSLSNPDTIFYLQREGLDDVYVINGQQLAFYSKNIRNINGERCATMPLTDIWTDIAWEGIAKEGSVTFKKGKKPERLLQRCIELVTDSGDLVLDSFLGSGTTAAVAQKMGRRYIGIELGNHAYTHCYPRLKMVTDGTDQGGISKAQNWKGGSGFKFYELAPSLLKEDKFGNLVINKEYNADMLAAAMAKQEGYTYQPDTALYWKQGRSSEHDYIYTTTQFLTVESLDAISETMQESESLLICCTAFQKECARHAANITVKKIPQMLLGRCQFSKDDYSLNIIDLPPLDDDPDDDFTEETPEEIAESKDNKLIQTSLF
jgi:adenine-specific DNA-methyltransferase